jgi:hypothetical protein
LPSGALVQIDSARQIGYGYDERIEVLGSTGMVSSTPPSGRRGISLHKASNR